MNVYYAITLIVLAIANLFYNYLINRAYNRIEMLEKAVSLLLDLEKSRLGLELEDKKK